MVVGSPGGPTIINTVFETILNVGVHGLAAQRAVNTPRIHHQWFPDQIRVEGGISPDTLALLKAKGQLNRHQPILAGELPPDCGWPGWFALDWLRSAILKLRPCGILMP